MTAWSACGLIRGNQGRNTVAASDRGRLIVRKTNKKMLVNYQSPAETWQCPGPGDAGGTRPRVLTTRAALMTIITQGQSATTGLVLLNKASFE